MKQILSTSLFAFFLSFTFLSAGSAGPLIVGNGSGLSEFNILFWQRQLGYFLGQCRALESCEKSLAAKDWASVENAATWVSSAEVRFEDDRAMGTKTMIFDRANSTLRLNKKALWLKSPAGDLIGMKLDDVSDFLWGLLATEFTGGGSGRASPSPDLSKFLTEFKKIMKSSGSEYTLNLADGRRLAAVNSGNSVAGFAILNEDEKAEALLFSNLGDFAECQATDGTLSSGHTITLETLDFAYFVGRLGTEAGSDEVSTVDVVFHGPVVYECKSGSETWSEAANVRLTVRLSQQKKSYGFEVGATRVRFDAIERR